MEFYDRNPFKEEISFRLEGYRTQKLTAAQQFIKNLIAYEYYEYERPSHYPFKLFYQYTKQEIYERFKTARPRAFVRNLDTNEDTSLLTFFWNYEVEEMRQRQQLLPEAAEFRKEMFSFLPVIHKVSALFEKRTPYELNKISLSTYYTKNEIPVEFIDLEAIEKLFLKMNTMILTHWSVHALVEFKENTGAVKGFIIDEIVKELDFYLHPRLLSTDHLTCLHRASCQWFEQLLEQMRHFLGLDKNTPLLDDLRNHFYGPLRLENYRLPLVSIITEKPRRARIVNAYIAKNTSSDSVSTKASPATESLTADQEPAIEFPVRVFKDAAAYQFFDTCARHMNSIKMISFLYRKMSEKDEVIHLRDTEFRKWFNEQPDYPLKLEHATDTYDRAATPERETWMKLMEYFYEKIR